jgi:hypothetical protein
MRNLGRKLNSGAPQTAFIHGPRGERVKSDPLQTFGMLRCSGHFARPSWRAPGYAEDDLNGTYDGILASAALDAQALAHAMNEEQEPHSRLRNT